MHKTFVLDEAHTVALVGEANLERRAPVLVAEVVRGLNKDTSKFRVCCLAHGLALLGYCCRLTECIRFRADSIFISPIAGNSDYRKLAKFATGLVPVLVPVWFCGCFSVLPRSPG
jgi:hypothetical protein